ncbi:MAG: 2-oxoisovalerate dehydrogenase [Chloroflexi bacterium]|nr:2-oxoisovalerate dehydrogenase [Chloroflexota bacterium]
MPEEIIFLVEEAPEGGYIARALGYSIFTEGDTWDELKVMVQDAVHCHFEEEEQPRVVRLHQVREEVMAV